MGWYRNQILSWMSGNGKGEINERQSGGGTWDFLHLDWETQNKE
jgi:hypothetical protein